VVVWLIVNKEVLMEGITPKQKKVLDFIRERVRENLPPTIREIAAQMGFSSTGTVRDYLNALEKKGCLKRGKKSSRAIELAEKCGKIPIISMVAAGKPAWAYEDIRGYVDPDDLFLGRISQQDVFALEVKGDSMVEAGILDGDIAVIKKQQAADNGDIVVALLEDNEATLKKLRYRNKRPLLEAANKNYSPIEKEFTVIGKLITILRKYNR